MIQVFFRTRNIKTQKIGTHMQAFPLKKEKKSKNCFPFFRQIFSHTYKDQKAEI